MLGPYACDGCTVIGECRGDPPLTLLLHEPKSAKAEFTAIFQNLLELRWLTAADQSPLPPFRRLAATLRNHRDGVLNAITLGLSNSRLEALNGKVRLLIRRSYGFHSPEPLIALIHLCCGPITIELPT